MLKKNLPKDIVIEILSWLPTNSLVRFKSVHKSWYALIESPQFVAMQLHNSNGIHFLIGNKILTDTSRRDRISWSLLTVDDKMSATSNGEDVSFAMKCLDLPYFSSPYNGWNAFSNLCDGIICFYDPQDEDDGIIIMANPGTREFRVLPESCCCPYPNAFWNCQCPRVTYAVGLGFDHKTNDYKVIRILEIQTPYLSPGDIQAEVYTSSTNIWREIEYTDYWRPIRQGGPSIYWNGVYYFPAVKHEDYSRGILSFDFSDEVFEFITIPEHLPFFYKLIELHETLGLIAYPDPKQEVEKRFEIWVMSEYGADRVWTKLLSTEPLLELDRPLGFWKSNELFLLLSTGVIASYNIVTNQMNTLLPINSEDFMNNHICFIELYKGSLVSINKGIIHGR